MLSSKKYGGRAWTGLFWFTTEKKGGFCEHGNELRVSQNTENAFTSCGVTQEGLRSMKFVISGWN